MTVKHTPGPWFAIPNPSIGGAKIRIDVRPDVHWENFGELAYVSGTANARLIAAAPELLAALAELVSLIETAWPVSSKKLDLEPYREIVKRARGLA